MPSPQGTLRVALCQLNTTVGDIDGNSGKIADYLKRSARAGARIAVFPELAVCGYPPEDLLLKDHFLKAAREAIDGLARQAQGMAAMVGYPELDEDKGAVYDSLAVLEDGKVSVSYRKMRLPNYGVFDEKRYFAEGDEAVVRECAGEVVGLTVCEDIWVEGPPISDQAAMGAQAVINISASPYHQGKGKVRERLVAHRASENGVFIVYCNLVGGQDELVFDGHSLVVGPKGELVARAKQFEEELMVVDLDLHGGGRHADNAHLAELLSDEQEVYRALVLGTRDYVRKNDFEHVVIGLSGGIDSSLVACVAVDALGAENVSGAVMPSPYSSAETQHDARALAGNLGIELYELPIAESMAAYEKILEPAFAATEPDLTEENIQARIRGNLLMALSNKFGWLVLTTGNKSEYSVGYTTLYGDMAGGFAVLKDVPKTLVYRLARFRNGQPSGDEAIPRSVIDRPPSAELRPGQRDEDSLPPYELLDPILEEYVENDWSIEQIAAEGFDRDVVARTVQMVDLAEYKRRQAPPGIKIRPKAFGRDRRLPITNGFRG